MIIHGYETYMDGVAASSFNAECVSRNIEPATIIIFSDWLRQSLNPLYHGKTEQYKVIKLQFRFEYYSDNDLLQCAGGLTKALEHCQLKFSNMDYYFDCIISGVSFVDIEGGKKELAVTLNSSYAYLPKVIETLDQVSSKIINVPGNLPAQAVVSVTPTINIASLTIGTFTINNLTSDQPVIVDAEQYLVTQSGANKYSDFDGDFLILQPGSNTINVSNSNCTISISYKPKWL